MVAEASEPGFDDCLQLRIVVAPRPRVLEARVLEQLRHLQCRHELLPLVGERGNVDVPPVATAEQTGWTSVRMLRTTALWNKGFSPQRHARDVDLMHVEVGV